jgi:hypothetical protein
MKKIKLLFIGYIASIFIFSNELFAATSGKESSDL